MSLDTEGRGDPMDRLESTLTKMFGEDGVNGLDHFFEKDKAGQHIVTDEQVALVKKRVCAAFGIPDGFANNLNFSSSGKPGVISRSTDGCALLERADLTIPFGGDSALNPSEHAAALMMDFKITPSEQQHRVLFDESSFQTPVDLELSVAKRIFSLLGDALEKKRSPWIISPISGDRILMVTQETSGNYSCSLINPDATSESIPVIDSAKTYAIGGEWLRNRDDLVIKFKIPHWEGIQSHHIIVDMWGPDMQMRDRGVLVFDPKKTNDSNFRTTGQELPNLAVVNYLKDRRRSFLALAVDLTFNGQGA